MIYFAMAFTATISLPMLPVSSIANIKVTLSTTPRRASKTLALTSFLMVSKYFFTAAAHGAQRFDRERVVALFPVSPVDVAFLFSISIDVNKP